MMKFLRLLRLHYAFTWALPYFLGLIYTKSLHSIDKFDPLFVVAAFFYMISVNVHNDLCEGKTKGFSRTALAGIIAASLVVAIAIFASIYVIAATAVIYLYNWRLKKIRYLDLVPPVAPPLAVLAVLGISDPLFIFAIIVSAITTQTFQQFVDGDVRTKSYFHLYVISYVLLLFSTSALLFRINTVVSWMVFIGAAWTAAWVSSKANRRKLFVGMSKFTVDRRNAVITNTWVAIIFLIGWYLLL